MYDYQLDVTDEEFTLTEEEQTVYELDVSDDSAEWSVEEYVRTRETDYPEYDGLYSADARFTNQVFDTSEKVMRDDFTVHAINYTEAPNGSGITVTIGG